MQGTPGAAWSPSESTMATLLTISYIVFKMSISLLFVHRLGQSEDNAADLSW